jgi:hypothetical protein
MNDFSLWRFGRVIQNDALRIARPVLYATVALFGVTVLSYLGTFQRALPDEQALSFRMFGIYLNLAGLLLTGVAFQDLHHRLDRYRYLMLPVSSLERLLSRYLLTGPLFVLYATLAFAAFDVAGKQAVQMYWEIDLPLFSPFTGQTMWLIFFYMLAHSIMLIGAICFRAHAFLRTLLVLMALVLLMVLVENLAERIFFPELYSWKQFERLSPLPVELAPEFQAPWANMAFISGLFVWLFFIAYACLRDHETSDGV